MTLGAFLIGLTIYAVIRVIISGFFTVRPDQRAALTTFGRAQRLPKSDLPEPAPDDADRYVYPMIRVIRLGGPYFK